MRILALTGTPGTGKTTIAQALPRTISVVPANGLAEQVGAIEGHDEARQADIVDSAILAERARDHLPDEGPVVIEGGLAHLAAPDAVVVLRCHPDVLRERLEARGWPAEKVEENVMAETLDVIVAEVDAEDAWELDTTDLAPKDAAERIVALLTGKGFVSDQLQPLGTADWSQTLMGDGPG